ncbi:thioesterase [Nibrella saemangeumensis]|uniref:Thioesterase n=1 Tax=Nibrella saemangeumensis TaxID=1084526 RepID=A0ABP8NI11_9BACT
MQPHGETFTIRVSEIDANRQLTPYALVNLFQEVAWNHADALGVSVYRLLDEGLTWVLYRMKLAVSRWPQHRDPIRLETLPTGIEKRFFYRDFYVYDAEGTCIAHATSTWLVMDIRKRQLVSVPAFIQDTFTPFAGVTALPKANDRLPAPTEPVTQVSFQIRGQDLDVNGHVNNSVYFQWLLESMPSGTQQPVLQSLDVLFRAESNREDEIIAQVSEAQPGEYAHRLLNQHGKELVQARSVWSAAEQTD